MPRYIDADDLSNFANNQVGGITANHIMRFPSADVEPVKHGRWEYNQDVILDWVCSECAYYVPHEYKFCPNCGAKMDGGKNDE